MTWAEKPVVVYRPSTIGLHLCVLIHAFVQCSDYTNTIKIMLSTFNVACLSLKDEDIFSPHSLFASLSEHLL